MSRFAKVIMLIVVFFGFMLLLTFVSPSIRQYATELARGSRLPFWLVGLAAPILLVGTPVGQPKQFGERTTKVQSSVTAQFSVAGQRILTWMDDRTVRLWDATDGTPACQPFRHVKPKDRDWEIREAQWSPDGRRILTLSSARLWRARNSAFSVTLERALPWVCR